MEKLLHFLLTYQDYVFLAMFGALALVAFVNFVHNPYAKQNTQLKRFNQRTLQKPSCIVLQVKHLPNEYQRQWRAYVNSGCAKPSIVFEFVKLPQKYLLWFVHFVSTATSIAYVFIAILSDLPHLFTTQVAFLLSGALALLVNKLIKEINLAQARRVFGKFLHDLNAVTHILKNENVPTEQPTASPNGCSTDLSTQQPMATPPTQSAPTQQPAEPLPTESITPSSPPQSTAISQDVVDKTPTDPMSASLPPQSPIKSTDDVIQTAVQILQQKGLDNPRTAEEQRKLNIALNNLLQACCKRKA